MAKKIDNRLAETRAHSHSGEAEYDDAELRDHLVKYHGWSLGMIKQRGWAEDGSYARGWHRNAHATAHLDPQG